jgi:hypothetical protein
VGQGHDFHLRLRPVPFKDVGAGGIPTARSAFFARHRVFLQLVEAVTDMGGLGGRVGERDGAAEGVAGLGLPAERAEERAAEAVQVEVAAERASSGSIMASAASGPRTLETATARLRVTTGEGCICSSAA